jgi:hypothetical protein
MSVRLIAIDPWDCGCTECIIGEYKPLMSATDDDIADLLAGRLRDNTYDGSLDVSMNYRTSKDDNSRLTLEIESVTVTYTDYDGSERTWSPDPYRAGLA